MINIDFEKLTPMMQQYLQTKESYPDAILMFRLGDFYEMFFEDAIKASKILDIVLTGRDAGQKEKIPMCGVPFHAADNYINKLVNSGNKVAICEQLEDPKASKGLVKRGVTKVITPGTNLNISEADNSSSYLASIFSNEAGSALSYVDFSTGNLFFTFSKKSFSSSNDLFNQVSVLEIRELISNISNNQISELCNAKKIYLNINNKIEFNKETFDTFIGNLETDIATLNLINSEITIRMSLFQLFEYLRETQFNQISHIRKIHYINLSAFMTLDKHTLYSLDVFSENEKSIEGTLLHLLNKTKTAMGSRKLRYFLEHPLKEKTSIQTRLNIVEKFSENFANLDNIRKILNEIYDIERIMVRISGNSNSPKDMIQLRNSFRSLEDLYNMVCNLQFDGNLVADISKLLLLKEIYSKISLAIEDEAPYSPKEGGVIKDGFSIELDTLKSTSIYSKTWIIDYENELRNETGIPKLKIKYNKILGYFIEISNSYLEKVPDYFIRKQTLVGSERFFTDKLKNTEMSILNAKDRINSLEYDIYENIRKEILENYDLILDVANVIGTIDVFSNFAFISHKYNYVKPEISTDNNLVIKRGRHPIVEQNVQIFIDNSTVIDNNKNFILLTGPNMAGKSTYMRQIALISILMQVGSFVPADYAKLPVFDRIFTRIGAHDNLYFGESTFMVEMKEMADIISNSTKNSLIILDEVGRGTSTYDGLSLAKALIEYIIDKINAKTIFATHFHELTSLEGKYSSIKNQTMEAQEKNGEILFLRKVVDGASDKSYGIHVATLAGIKDSIISKAKIYLDEYEKNHTALRQISFINDNQEKILLSNVEEEKTQYKAILDNYNFLKKKIIGLDINSMTPIESLLELEKIKELLKNLDEK